MNSDFLLSQLRAALLAAVAFAAGKGWMTPTDATFATAMVTTLGPILAPFILSMYSNYGVKKVPQHSTAIDMVTAKPIGTPVPLASGVTAKVVGALLLGILINGAMLGNHASAQTPGTDANGNPIIGNSCDLLTILKGVTIANIGARIKACSKDDLALAIADAGVQVPPDNLALACYMPVAALVAAAQSGGVVYTVQKARDAKRARILQACQAWLTDTLAP